MQVTRVGNMHSTCILIAFLFPKEKPEDKQTGKTAMQRLSTMVTMVKVSFTFFPFQHVSLMSNPY